MNIEFFLDIQHFWAQMLNSSRVAFNLIQTIKLNSIQPIDGGLNENIAAQ